MSVYLWGFVGVFMECWCDELRYKYCISSFGGDKCSKLRVYLLRQSPPKRCFFSNCFLPGDEQPLVLTLESTSTNQF